MPYAYPFSLKEVIMLKSPLMIWGWCPNTTPIFCMSSRNSSFPTILGPLKLDMVLPSTNPISLKFADMMWLVYMNFSKTTQTRFHKITGPPKKPSTLVTIDLHNFQHLEARSFMVSWSHLVSWIMKVVGLSLLIIFLSILFFPFPFIPLIFHNVIFIVKP